MRARRRGEDRAAEAPVDETLDGAHLAANVEVSGHEPDTTDQTPPPSMVGGG